MNIQERSAGRSIIGHVARRATLLGLGLLLGASVVLATPGDLDPSFGTAGNGRVLESFGAAAPFAVTSLVQSDGKVVIAGAVRATSQMFVARYNSDGSLDTSFSADGFTAIAMAYGPGTVFAMLQQPDGKLVLTGNGQNNRAGDYDVVVVRLNVDGSLDSSFGTSGIAQMKDGGYDEFGAAIIRQADGKLLVAGSSNANRGYDFDFVRFNTDGSVDTSFGNSGRLLVDFGGNDDQANALVQQPDGSIIASGFARDSNGFSSMAVLRMSAAGALDTGFGSGGKVTVPFGSLQSAAAAVALQSDGKIVLAGAVAEPTTGTTPAASTDAALARLNANGALDTSFGAGGKLSINYGGKDFLSAIIAEPSGAIDVSGRLQASTPPPNDAFVARFTAAGAVDTSFGNGGKTLIDCGDLASASNCTAYALARQSDGKLIVSGYDDVQTRMLVARLLASGGYAGNVGFASTSGTVAESAGTQSIVLRRTGGSSGAVSVDYTVTPGTALQGSDITFTNGTASWADGDTADKTISVGIVNDSLVEFTETYTVTLANATGGAGLAASRFVAAITDDDTATNGALQFTTTSTSVSEAAGSVSLSVGRPGGSVGAVSVTYATADGTAAAATRYTTTTGTLNWSDGDTALKTITVPIINDTVAEPDQTFTVTLSAPTGGAILGPNTTATVTIIDDDGPGTVTLAAATTNVQEAVGTLALNVSRTLGSKGAITVDYATTGGTAVSGTDFTATSGTLSWADGDTADKTISIPINDDAQPEGAETFTLTLSNPSGGATLGTNAVTTITILPNDSPGAVGFDPTSVSVAVNAGNATLTVRRLPGATGAATVQYQTANGSAIAGTQYTTTTGTLNWADGDFASKTISVPITSITSGTSAASFTVTLFNPTGSAGLDASSIATVTILASDATSSGGGGGKSSCFIATAAFGTPMAAEVMQLRYFRDGFLLKRGWGRWFVQFYYAHSPPIADFIRARNWLRAVVRVALKPLIWFAQWENAPQQRARAASQPTAPQQPAPADPRAVATQLTATLPQWRKERT